MIIVDLLQAIDMNEALRQLPAGDFQRIAALEFFDEHEILTQLLEHYCLSWATQGHSGNVSREDQTSTKILFSKLIVSFLKFARHIFRFALILHCEKAPSCFWDEYWEYSN